MHRNERRRHADRSIFRARSHHFIERSIILRPAIGIAGTIGLDRSDVDLFGSQHFRPTDGDGEKMRVAERDVGHRNADGRADADAVRFGNGNVRIGEGGSADRAQSFIAHQQPVANSEPVTDAFEGPPFALFSALSVAALDGGGLWSRAASAAHTQESMPPLSRTTARFPSLVAFDTMTVSEASRSLPPDFMTVEDVSLQFNLERRHEGRSRSVFLVLTPA